MSTTLKVSNGDLDIDQATGMPSLIDGVQKCSQDIANVMMVERRQTNRSGKLFRRVYGSELTLMQTPTFFSGVIGKPLVAKKLQEAVQSLIDMQEHDPYVTDDERIERIERLLVESLDITDFIYFLEVSVRSGSPVPTVSNIEAVRLDHQFALTGGVVDAPNGGTLAL